MKEYRQARPLQKWWKFVLSQFVLRKYFFVKIICSTHQRKCFSTILGKFLKIEFLKEYRQARPLQKWWKFVLSQFLLRKFFCQNYLFYSSKEVFLHNLRQYLENWIFEGISTGATLTKMVKICIISICAKKIFFVKIICSTHQRKCFSTVLGNFWKFDFLKEYRQARTLSKWWKFVLSQFVLRKYFLSKLFVLLIKGSVSPQFKAIFGKLNFWRNIDRRGPYKNGEKLNYLKVC